MAKGQTSPLGQSLKVNSASTLTVKVREQPPSTTRQQNTGQLLTYFNARALVMRRDFPSANIGRRSWPTSNRRRCALGTRVAGPSASRATASPGAVLGGAARRPSTKGRLPNPAVEGRGSVVRGGRALVEGRASALAAHPPTERGGRLVAPGVGARPKRWKGVAQTEKRKGAPPARRGWADQGGGRRLSGFLSDWSTCGCTAVGGASSEDNLCRDR